MTFYIMPEYAPSKNGLYMFSKTVNIEKDCSARINIFAAMRYILYVNGEYVCEGPCRSHEKVRYYDDVTCNLKGGENIIEVKVMHTMDYFTTVNKTIVPMLVFEANTSNGENIISDETWKCRYLGEYKLIRHAMRSLPPFEIVSKGEKDICLPIEKTDRCIFQENGNYISAGAAFNFLLEKRPIPMIYPGEEFEISPIKKGDGYAEYDSLEYMTAKVKFHIAPNSNVRIMYCECYENPDGSKGKRDDTTGVLNGYFDEVHTDDSEFVYEPYWFRAFRYIRIEGEGVSLVTARRVNYPYDMRGEFTCSDDMYNKMYSISQNTILCCHHEIISDCPYYEQQQYQFDSSLQVAATFNMTDDRRLIKKCLMEFAMSQQPSGLQLSTYPQFWAVQVIPGFSLAWVMMLRWYLDNTRDVDFVSRYIPNVDALLGYFERAFRDKGFLTTTRHWDFIDWVPGWENRGGGCVPLKDDEAHTLYNMYYVTALNDAAYICEKCNRPAFAEEYRIRSKEVSDVVNSLCYNEKTGMYKDGSVTETYSMHTSVWAILSGIADGDKAKELVDKLDTEGIKKCTFAMNYHLLRALEKTDCYDRAFKVFEDWKVMIDNGCTTWCENPDSPRSECHGWSSAPLHDFPRHILGVQIGFDDEIVIQPYTGHLSFARGVVPGRFGDIAVNWNIDGNVFSISIDSPEGINKKLVMPDGSVHCFDGKIGNFTCLVDNKA